MMKTARQASAETSRKHNRLPEAEVQALRDKLNNEEYLEAAILRMATLMTDELLDIPRGGLIYERAGR